MTDARKPSEKPIVPDFLVWHCANCGAAANATKKPCDCATNVGVRTGPNGKREQTWWDDSSSDAPTYDELSALLAQMAAALEKAQFQLSQLDPAPEFKDAIDKEISDAGDALTAYRTLSPDPQWQRVPEKPSADVVQAAIDTFGIQPGFAAMERAIKAAFKRARGEG